MKWIITIVAVAGIIIHLVFPDLKIDAITISLLVLALLPWIYPIIASVEIPGIGKVEFQKSSEEAVTPSEKKESKKILTETMGFFNQEGLNQIVNESDFVVDGESVLKLLLVYSTSKQKTWLITTNRQLFCILDDENTRASGRLIQWRLPLLDASPVMVYKSSRGNPVFKIGIKKNWLYSTSIHPSQEILKHEIESMIAESIRGSSTS